MGSSHIPLKRSLLLSAFFTVSLFSSHALSQQTTTTGTTAAATTSTRNTQSTSTTQQNPPASTAPRPSTAPTSQTNSRSTSSTSSLTGLPNLTTSTGPAPPALTGLPTLSKTVNTVIPEYPPPTIPPTQNAPFMNHSTLPDGTVFICVGAILGAFGLAIIVWRGIVACLLHRSVERAALAQHAANDKASSFPAPPSQFYKFLDPDPSPGRGGGGAAALAGRMNRKSHRGPTPSATASQTNLFFSPTAAPGGSTGVASSSHRDSRFLPSGFYASASPMPGGPGSLGHQAGTSISLSTLRPSSRGRTMNGISPPESPSMEPRRNFSASSVSLNRPPSANGRAPSAFLDDLLDEPGSQQFPQQQPQGQGQGQWPPRFPAAPDGQYYSQSPSPPGNRGY